MWSRCFFCPRYFFVQVKNAGLSVGQNVVRLIAHQPEANFRSCATLVVGKQPIKADLRSLDPLTQLRCEKANKRVTVSFSSLFCSLSLVTFQENEGNSVSDINLEILWKMKKNVEQLKVMKNFNRRRIRSLWVFLNPFIHNFITRIFWNVLFQTGLFSYRPLFDTHTFVIGTLVDTIRYQRDHNNRFLTYARVLLFASFQLIISVFFTVLEGRVLA